MPGGSTSRATLAVALLLANSPRNAANDFLFLPFDFGTAAAALLAAGSPGNDVRLARGWRLIGVAWLVSGIGSPSFTRFCRARCHCSSDRFALTARGRVSYSASCSCPRIHFLLGITR